MDQDVSIPAVAMMIILAICFVALVMLVVSLPAVKELLHMPLRAARNAHGPHSHPHPPGLQP